MFIKLIFFAFYCIYNKMSFMNQPCAKLVLRMMDLPANNTSTTVKSTNSVGWALNLRQQCAWTGINMKDVLGNLYYEYETFNIVLTSVTSALGSTAIGSTAEDRVVTAYLSGLNWKNQAYDTSKRSPTENTAIGNIYYTASSGTTVNGTISASPCTFTKSNSTSDLVITLLRNIDGFASIQGTADFNFIFNFSIFGVRDEKHMKN